MSKTAAQKKREAEELRARLEGSEVPTRVTLENQVTEGLSEAEKEALTRPTAEKADQGPDAPGKATEGQDGGQGKVILRSNPTRAQMRTYIVEWHWSGTCFHQHFHASDPAGLLQYVARVLGGQDAKIILDYDPLEIANQSEGPDEK